jgi:hypothetical protein
MSEWITDRLPTEADSDVMGKVWVWEDNAVYWSDYSVVTPGTPWMPINSPAPYVKPEPKRWKPENGKNYYYVVLKVEASGPIYYSEGAVCYPTICFQTQAEAEEAERCAYEALLNYHKELQNDQMES